MRGIKTAIIVMLVLLLVACATVNLDKAITGTNCKTKEECLKALNLKNPEKADLTFVVQPFQFRVGFKSGWGYTEPGTPRRAGDAAYCVADALRHEFGDSKILIGNNPENNEIPVSINDVRFGANMKYSEYCRIKASVLIDGENHNITGLGYIGPLRLSHDAQVYKGACVDIATQIKRITSKNN